MAMKNNVVYTYGRAVRTDRNGVQTIYPSQLAKTDGLSGVTTSVGDRKTPLPHSFVRRLHTSATGVITTHFGDGAKETLSGYAVDGYQNSSKEPSTWSSSVRDEAIENLWSQVRNGYRPLAAGDLSGIDISIDLVQYRQTLGMANVYKNGVNAMAAHARHYLPTSVRAQRALDRLNANNLHRDARARYARELDHHLNVLANARLQYVYGVKPTISTFVDLGKLATTPPPGSYNGWVRVEGYARRTTEHDLYRGAEPKTRYSGYTSERCRVTAFFAPKPSILSKMAQISSLNVVALIYEATPYSFVVDWFTNVGAWLRSVETAMVHGSEFRGGYISEGHLFTEKIQRRGRYGAFEYDWLATIDRRAFRRSTGISLPISSRPRFEWNFGLNQALNATALLKQKLGVFDTLLKLRGK